MDTTNSPFQPSPAFAPGWYIVTSPTSKAKIPVLSHPTMQVKIIAQLPSGYRIEVLNQDGIWLRIRLHDSQIGYVATANVIPATPVNTASTSSTRTDSVQHMYQTTSRNALQSEKITFTSQTRSKTAGVIILGAISGVFLLIGIFFGTTALESCPFGTTNPYLGGCTVVSYPYTGIGLFFTIVGLIGFISTIIIGFNMRSKKS